MHGNTRLESSISTLAGKLAALAYSLLSYALFLLVFIYFIGFLSSIGVPKDAPINLSCSRGKLQFSRHLQRHWTKSDRKIMYGELFRPVLRVKREPHPYP